MTRLVRAHPAWAISVIVLALGLLPSLVWAVRPDRQAEPQRSADRRYATQTGTRHQARSQHVRNRGDEDVDAAVETCAGLGLIHLAAKYGMPEDQEAVARRFAADFEPAYRAHAYRGCLRAFIEGGG